MSTVNPCVRQPSQDLLAWCFVIAVRALGFVETAAPQGDLDVQMDPNQEKVLDLMGRLKLSATEKTSVKIGGVGASSLGQRDPQAVVKILADRPIRAEVLMATLGKIWCPSKGVVCKELGENRFLVKFLQGSGKMKALEDGPWMVGRDLVVVAEFDGAKKIDEVEFTSIPIWARVTGMPLGLMTSAVGVMIGDMIGKFIEVEADDDGLVVGEFLRVKIRLDITKPLMRGVMIDVGDGVEEKPMWCPLCYEFLPDFCYICGVIGHTERGCEKKLGKGETPQFSRNVRCFPEKKLSGGGYGYRPGEKMYQRPKLTNGGSRSGGSWGSERSRGSDAPSWRKKVGEGTGGGEEAEVSSPVKVKNPEGRGSDVRKAILFTEGDKMAPGDEGAVLEVGGGPSKMEVEGELTKGEQEDGALQVVVTAPAKTHATVESDAIEKKQRKFKRQQRGPEFALPLGKDGGGVVDGKKRSREEVEDMVLEEGRKIKQVKESKLGSNTEMLAGPADRSCEKK